MTGSTRRGSRRGVEPFRVLFVCTGNICRSPSAELLARAWLAKNLGDAARMFEVASAGTQGLTGRLMDESAARALTEVGGDPRGFRARELEQFLVESADLVVGLAREHRAAAVSMAPQATRRAFTLVELDRLVTATEVRPTTGPGPSYAREVVAEAAERRGTLPPDGEDRDDVTDPIGRPLDVHREVAGEIAGAVQRVMSALAPSPDSFRERH